LEVATPLLEVRGLGKGFPGVKALDTVDLIVQSGEIHTLNSWWTKIVIGGLLLIFVGLQRLISRRAAQTT